MHVAINIVRTVEQNRKLNWNNITHISCLFLYDITCSLLTVTP
jgi:hypothetical protein